MRCCCCFVIFVCEPENAASFFLSCALCLCNIRFPDNTEIADFLCFVLRIASLSHCRPKWRQYDVRNISVAVKNGQIEPGNVSRRFNHVVVMMHKKQTSESLKDLIGSRERMPFKHYRRTLLRRRRCRSCFFFFLPTTFFSSRRRAGSRKRQWKRQHQSLSEYSGQINCPSAISQ